MHTVTLDLSSLPSWEGEQKILEVRAVDKSFTLAVVVTMGDQLDVFESRFFKKIICSRFDNMKWIATVTDVYWFCLVKNRAVLKKQCSFYDDPNPFYKKARIYFDNHDIPRALKFFKIAAEQNCSKAMLALGNLHFLNEDHYQAAQWWEKAALVRNLDAMSNLEKYYKIYNKNVLAQFWKKRAEICNEH